MGVFKKFYETAAAIGFWNASLLSLSRLFGALGTRVRIVKYYFTAQPVSSAQNGRWIRSGTFDIAWADAHCKLLGEADRPAEILAARFAQGDPLPRGR